jgi:hypothetical protein
MVLNSVTPAEAGVHDQSVENPAKQEDLNARKNPVQSSQKNCSSMFSGALLQMFRTVVSFRWGDDFQADGSIFRHPSHRPSEGWGKAGVQRLLLNT